MEAFRKRVDAYCRSAFVTIVDLNKPAGSELAASLGQYISPCLLIARLISVCRSAQFVECDATQWDDLVKAFEAAVQNSPQQSLDVVIANAGIVGKDDMFTLDGS